MSLGSRRCPKALMPSAALRMLSDTDIRNLWDYPTLPDISRHCLSLRSETKGLAISRLAWPEERF